MNLSHARVANLTARLLGDPDPSRFERSERLRGALKLVAPAQAAPKPSAEQRRTLILDAIKDGPRTSQEVAMASGLDIDDVRLDLKLLRSQGVVERGGQRRGPYSTVTWRLPGVADNAGPDTFRPTSEERLDQILVAMAKEDRLTASEIVDRVRGGRAQCNLALKLGVSRGLIVAAGGGRFVYYHLPVVA